MTFASAVPSIDLDAPMPGTAPRCPTCNTALEFGSDALGRTVQQCRYRCAPAQLVTPIGNGDAGAEAPRDVDTLSLACPCGAKLVIAKAVAGDFWPYRFEPARAREWLQKHSPCWRAL